MVQLILFSIPHTYIASVLDQIVSLLMLFACNSTASVLGASFIFPVQISSDLSYSLTKTVSLWVFENQNIFVFLRFSL